MIEFSCILKNYTTKDGKRSFGDISAKGKYLDNLDVKSSIPLNPEQTYFLKFTQDSRQPLPVAEGIYNVQIDDDGKQKTSAWLDERVESQGKNIIRIKTNSDLVSFVKKSGLKPFETAKQNEGEK